MTNSLTSTVLNRLAETNPGLLEKGRLPELAEYWGCTYIGLEVIGVTPAHVEVHKEPALAERIITARAAYCKAQRELDTLGASNRTQKWANIRKWHFIEGAVSWLKGETTEELSRAITGGMASALPTAKTALEPKVASRMRWEAVRSLVRVKEEQAYAQLMKQHKQSAVESQRYAAARELLAAMLLEASYATLPDYEWRGLGLVDVCYNLGLSGQPTKSGQADMQSKKVEYEVLPYHHDEAGVLVPTPMRHTLSANSNCGMEAGCMRVILALSVRSATASGDSAGIGTGTGAQALGLRELQPSKTSSQLCFYCAGGVGGEHRPVSAEHPMCSCFHRQLAGVREFPPEALERVEAALAAEAEILNRAITDQAASSIEAKLSRKGAYQLGGVSSCVTSARKRHLPWQESEDHQPAPPPKSEDPSVQRGYLAQVRYGLRRERSFWHGILVTALARDARVSGYPRLADFKGLAVLQTIPPAHAEIESALAACPGSSVDAAPPMSAASVSAQTIKWATPALVLEAAADLGLLYGLIGSVQGLGGPPPGHTTRAAPYRALWIAAAYAMAPLPALWSVRSVSDSKHGVPPKLLYEKTESGRTHQSDIHPLREAYYSTCARFLRHCPQLSLKQVPFLAHFLFCVDGKPRCVDMRVAAKRWYKKRQQRPRAPPPGLASSRLQSSLSQSMRSLDVAATAGRLAASEATGLSVCTFPDLKRSEHGFAPQPRIEQVAMRLAETSRAAIEHAARAGIAQKQETRTAQWQEQEQVRVQKMRWVSASVRVTSSGVRLAIEVMARGKPAQDTAAAVDEVNDLRECALEHLDALRLEFDEQRAQSLKRSPRSLEEVLVMAAYLGLPYGGDNGVEHLWIADAALCPVVPIGWVQYTATDGTPYYQNVWSGECMWEHPQVSFLRGAVSIIKLIVAPRKDARLAASTLAKITT